MKIVKVLIIKVENSDNVRGAENLTKSAFLSILKFSAYISRLLSHQILSSQTWQQPALQVPSCSPFSCLPWFYLQSYHLVMQLDSIKEVNPITYRSFILDIFFFRPMRIIESLFPFFFSFFPHAELLQGGPICPACVCCSPKPPDGCCPCCTSPPSSPASP